MTSGELRQSFLDFFREKEHTIVPSASLMPTSPNLQFTNAGMNQFVPYFLGTEKAPFDPPRAADTQKCIRAGGKHNDLEDVGYDTYHHTFFEMLGNWSFGNYFKREAIAWAWELLTKRWGIPKERLYATVYRPGEGDPATFDQEAYDHWKQMYEAEGLDPSIHIVDGNKADNFWMMGDTGPCGPCSEIHIDLTAAGDTEGKLVNADDPRCIEIWNLVFIQFNAETDGSFRPLPACHVDTGMGFERVCAVLEGTKQGTDFSTLASNYDTSVFGPLFAKLTELSGKSYRATVPEGGHRENLSEQEQIDVAFRVVGDHLRTISFSIADGIEPGNKERNSVVRNILRRAVRFGRVLGFSEKDHLLAQLAPTLIDQMGEAFPELVSRKERILEVLTQEETQFNRTLDRGLRLFDEAVAILGAGEPFPAETVVKLWETFGFPIDMTYLLLDERALEVERAEVERLVDVHKSTGKEGEVSETVSAVKIDTEVSSDFVGFDEDECEVQVVEWVENEDGVFAIVDRSPLYVEKGGQVGDTGSFSFGGETIPVLNTTSVGHALVVQLERKPSGDASIGVLKVDPDRRRNIERHHTATHLMHWALHEVVSREATQQGSLVAPDRLRFDFNSKALTPDQLREIERLVNECVARDETVSWFERPYAEIQGNSAVMQFFGDKYGDKVRVVQIGGEPGQLNGYSMELCGGTHVPRTGQVGLFKIRQEGAIAAGIRRIEALCGEAADAYLHEAVAERRDEIARLEGKLSEANKGLAALKLEAVPGPATPDVSVPERFTEIAEANEVLSALEDRRDQCNEAVVRAEKALKKAAASRQAAAAAEELEGVLAQLEGKSQPTLVHQLEGGDPGVLQECLNTLKRRGYAGVAVLALAHEGKVHLAAYVGPALTERFKAGELIGALAPIVEGKGGGRPEMARGAGSAPDKLPTLIEEAQRLLAAE